MRRPALALAALMLAREDAGLNQAELAVHAGLAVGTLSELEAGATDPSWSSVRALVGALNLSLVQLGRMVEAGE